MDVAKVLAISLLATSLISPSLSQAVTIAQSTIQVGCGSSVSETRLVTSTDSISCTNTAGGIGGSTITNADAAINFSTAPSTSVSADINATGTRFDSSSSGITSTTFFMGIVSLDIAPVTTSTIPVSFTASGGVTIDGGIYSDFSGGSAFTIFNNPSDPSFTFPTDDFSAVVSGVGAAAFDETLSLDLALPPPGEYFNILMQAGCVARVSAGGAPDDPTKTGSTSCSAFVDPAFAFDQAAFDLQMGADTFLLEDYYRIDLSDNLVIPVPAAVWLFASGLVGLIAIARREIS